ncbi:MAG: DUF1501 domain-containing protein [Roseiflexaceae bacterium]
MSITRRQFLVGGCSAAIAAMAGGRIGGLVFEDLDVAAASRNATTNDQILVMVFLRGGCDGLSLVSPFDDPTYRVSRGSIAVPESPTNDLILNINNPGFFAGLSASNQSNFALHANTQGTVTNNGNPVGTFSLKELYDSGNLAFVHACGLDDDTRSHFDAMDYIERGTPGNKSTSTGWLTRHIQSMNESDGVIPTLAASTNAPASLLGATQAIAATSANSYRLDHHWRYNNTATNANPADALLSTLDQLYDGTSGVVNAGRRTIEAIRALRTVSGYTTSITTYPSGGFGDSLKTVAQIIKLDLGLKIASIDLGGWDHHENQGVNGGTYANLMTTLSRGLYSFYNDLNAYSNRLTIVVMSEFGRRLGVNASGGTDHGHGNTMMVLGGNVNGGKVYGRWPGLEDLDQGQDLKITTDYRTVLGEAVTRVLGNNKLGTVFPNITPEIYSTATALNIFNGTDPAEIDYTSSMYQAFLPHVTR